MIDARAAHFAIGKSTSSKLSTSSNEITRFSDSNEHGDEALPWFEELLLSSSSACDSFLSPIDVCRCWLSRSASGVLSAGFALVSERRT